ncbi:uncharacterized protein EDB91DRAFT_1016867, partial [Suillus paluster]|uniref:uncharacterized protein n=1 Tax=Suillus paluster TaxID=48578 RepID=UPI001B87B19E
KVFFEPPKEEHLHIVVKRRPPNIRIVNQRRTYLKRAVEIGGKPVTFSTKQRRNKVEYLCSRPREAEDPVPVTLLEPI